MSATFDSLRKLLLAYPEVPEAEFKAALRAQWAILAVDERAAIEALPELLPADAAARRACSDLIQETVTATGKLNADAQRRLTKVMRLLAADTATLHPDEGIVGRGEARTDQGRRA